MAAREDAARFFERWHEFYLLAGTAAVTLVGLLFVSLSFNLDTLIHESKAHVLAYARSTLLTFTYLLIVCLGFLVPHQTPAMLGVLIVVASGVVLTIQLVSLRPRTGLVPTPFDRRMRRRARLYIGCYLVAILNSVLMVVGRAPELTYNMIGVVCALLGNAMGVSWDLLVEVGKLKAQAREAALER